MLQTRKPIMCLSEDDNGFVYRHVRIAYVKGIPIMFKTDLNPKEWDNLLEGKYNLNQITRFEFKGRF